MDYVVSVECVDIVKKSGSRSPQLYVLQVTWSSQKSSRVGRPYIEFFDYRTKLQEAAKGQSNISIPEIPGIKSFERSIFSKDAKKRKKTIEEFCKAVLSLPEDFSRSKLVTEFYDADKSSLRTIEMCPDSLQTMPIPNDIIQQLRCHAHTDQAGTHPVVTGRTNSMQGKDPVLWPPSGSHPALERSISDPAPESVHYTATCDYTKQRDNEVNLKQGCVVDVQQKDLTGWWFVHVEESDEQGWAPGSLLEPTNPFVETTTPSPSNDGTTLYMTTASHKADNTDEISCEKGQLVEVLEFRMDGWWKVKRSSKEGLIPAIHLEPVAKQDGQTKKLKSSLYHHNSIYRKDCPPPRSSAKSVFDQNNAAKKKKAKDLTYAEIAFEEAPKSSSHGNNMRPIILGDSSCTEYTEVLPISLPAHRPVNKSASTGHEAQDSNRKTASEPKRSNYQNWKAQPINTGYLNVEIGRDGPKFETQVFEVIADHDCRSMAQNRLEVKKGDFVQAEKVEAHRALCGLLNDDQSTSSLKGWIPTEKLKSVYTAELSLQNQSKQYNAPAPPSPKAPVIVPRRPHSTATSPTERTRHASAGKLTHAHPAAPTKHRPASLNPSQTNTTQNVALDYIRSDLPPEPSGPSVEHPKAADNTQPQTRPVVPTEQEQPFPELPPESPTNPTPPPLSPKAVTPGAPPIRDKNRKHHEAHLNQRWFVGKMSRSDCEVLFQQHAKEKDFVIRESTYRIGHYTLTVQYNARQRHFPIILTEDDKYFIGKHNFKNLVNIVQYYQKNPLIYGDDGTPQPLGQPLLISEC